MRRANLQALLVLGIICSTSAAPYSKYGRTCKDIGCLPREVCVMAYESCSFSQQENVSCGRYPTCKKNTDQATQQNAGSSSPGSPSSNPNTNVWNFPATVKYTTERTTTTTTTRRPWSTQPSYFAPTTTRRSWTTTAPFYNPANPSYNGGGGYFGNRYGDDTTFGGSSGTRYTTKRPSSSGSGFDGFFSGLSNVLSGEVGKFFNSAISNRGGSSGGFGSLFGGGNTRPLTENRNYGLFSENTGGSTGGSSSNRGTSETVGGYPVTRYGEASAPSSNPTGGSQASHGNIGWKLT